MTTIRAHFDGHAIVPDEPVNLPVGQPLTIHVDAAAFEQPRLTREEIDRLFDEMAKLRVAVPHPVDDSRDSIYSGTIDDPR